jgi:propionyl-CoA carboxylase beta chain
VPKLCVVTRKAYGGAYIVMSSKYIRTDLVYAWPTAEIAVMGPKGAAEVIFRKEIQLAVDPEKVLNEKINHYRRTFVNPFLAAKRGYIDDVIFPRDTRHRLIRTLQMLGGKTARQPERKHGNIPL